MRTRVFWDTNIYIYLFDRDSIFFDRTAALRKRMLERNDELITSAMTLGEVQVWPRRQKNLSLASDYRDAIRRTSTVVPFDDTAADIFAALREDSSIKPPDAIQLSCAAAARCEIFVTNDLNLHRLRVPGIHFITGFDRLPF